MPLDSSATLHWGKIPFRGDRDYSTAATLQDVLADGSQSCTTHLELNVAGYTQPVNAKKPEDGWECYVVADLAGSLVNPIKLIKDDDSNRGWYTHAIDVKMWFDPSSQYVVDEDAPQSSAPVGSASSGGNVGFFGDQLTAGANWEQSREYQDFELTNLTSKQAGNPTMEHHVKLNMSNAGGGYVNPYSLIDTTPPHNLDGLVERSTSNYELTSAASFVTQLPTKTLPDPADLHVTIEHHLAIIVFSQYDYSDDPHMYGLGESDKFDDTITDWQFYVAWIGTWAAAVNWSTSAWNFHVDWQNETVTWK